MSRCFPFPPPGYETKVRTGDIDLLAKEKHKEKKHKKDKKDKEKREGKEKKDKDRRKDKKEKRKDKKAKDGDDGNAKKSDEKRTEGQPEFSNRQKHGPNGLLNVDIKDLKYVQELDRRYRNDERATGSQVVEKIMVTDRRHLLADQSREKDRIKDKKEDVNAQRNHVEGRYSEKAFVHNFPSIDQTRLGGIAKPIEKQREVHRNGERAGSQVVQKIMVSGQKPLLANQSREKERLKDKKEDNRAVNGQRNHVEGNSSAQTFVQNFPSIDQRRLAGIAKPIEKQLEVYRNGEKANGSQVAQKIMASGQRPLPNQFRENERIKEKKADDRTINGPNHVVGKSSEQAFVQSFPSTDQRRLEAIAKPIGQDVEKQMEGSGRKKSTDYDSKDHKSKEKGKEKKVKSKDKDRDNKKEKEKVKEIRKPSAEQPKLEGSGNVSLDAFSNKTSDLLQMKGKNSATGGNLGKRKELEMNGYLHENGFLPHKVPRSVSSHPVMENGRKPEPSQTVQFITEGQGGANNCKADVKEHRINGLVGSEQPNTCSTKPSSSSFKVYENGGASTKPPHPDSKYLSEILSIPKIEDKLDFDDQEWLFSSNGSESKKPKVGAPEVDKLPQVWAEAMEIELADVYALPYVIPY